MPAGTYALSQGTLTVTHNALTLSGAGAGITTVDGGGSRILLVGAAALVTVSGLTLRGGNAGTSAGGALSNLGLTIVTRSAITNNTARNGGGLTNAASGHLWLFQSVVMSDTAPSGVGGGLANAGTLAVSGSVLSENTALTGGAIASTGTLTLTSSSVTTNTSTLSGCCFNSGGGGLYTTGTATVIGSTFRSNAEATSVPAASTIAGL